MAEWGGWLHSSRQTDPAKDGSDELPGTKRETPEAAEWPMVATGEQLWPRFSSEPPGVWTVQGPA